MQNYSLKLESEVFDSFRCVKAANSCDLDVKKKSTHEFSVDCDLTTPYNIGLIVGASGSGKSTLARKIFGDDCFDVQLDRSKAILDLLPEALTYDECVNLLTGIGLTAVVTWIRPINTLSTGQSARAEAALLMSKSDNVIIDEFTSVVDRTVAKVMAHCVQKFARKNNKRITLCSCHYDIIDWVNPDWVIDCNTQKFIDRRLLQQSFNRSDKLKFEVKQVDRATWKHFSKYHYLSERLPGGKTYVFGLFHNNDQIGFQCFAEYTPTRHGKRCIMHSNRTVIHPDYCGLGLGIKLINACSAFMYKKGMRIMAKFSNVALYKSRLKDPNWTLRDSGWYTCERPGGNMTRKSGFRNKVKWWSFEYNGYAH